MQAFLPPDLTRDLGPQVAAGLQLLSTAALVDPRAIEPAQEARGAIARGLAQQWFGVYIRPATHSDAWLVEGGRAGHEAHCPGMRLQGARLRPWAFQPPSAGRDWL